MRIYYSLYGRLLDKALLLASYKTVRRVQGAAGIDGQTLGDFGAFLDDNLAQLLLELQTKQYRPQPVRRVEIPKEDGVNGNLKISIGKNNIGFFYCFKRAQGNIVGITYSHAD